MASRPTLQIYDDYAAEEAAQGPQSPAQLWLDAVCTNAERESQAGLFALLRGRGRQSTDRTVPTLNRARALISKAFPFFSPGGAGAGADADAPAKARACLYLYQRSLHRVLRATLGATAASGGHACAEDLPPETRDWHVRSVVDEEAMQLGLVHACMEAVHYVRLPAPEDAFPALTLRLGRELCGLELWRGVRWVAALLGKDGGDGVPAMPAELLSYFALIEQRVVEEMALLDGASFHGHVVALRGAGAPEGEARVGPDGERLPREAAPIRYVMEAFMRASRALAEARCAAVCAAAAAAVPALGAPGAGAAFAAAAASALDWLLYAHYDVLFRQHSSVVAVACVYFTARACGVQGLSFRRCAALGAALPGHSEATFAQVELHPVSSAARGARAAKARRGGGGGGGSEGWSDSDGDGDGESDGDGAAPAGEEVPVVRGSVREYYNTVFLPVMEHQEHRELFGPAAAALEEALAAAELAAALDRTAPRPAPPPLPAAGGSTKGGKKAGARAPLGSVQPNVKRGLE